KPRPASKARNGSKARGGSKTSRLEDASREELYERAKALDIPGRSTMSKKELVKAISGRS
ncbi:MAG TPA: Rho termination factor N-terminal domain-containing protein, partial [Acidimicrobiia bacterium]|nr:Rho termination factor N-terminal domain-containing protein [Acidimicrobiia bacterium]